MQSRTAELFAMRETSSPDSTKPLSAQILDLRPPPLRDARIEAVAQGVLELEIDLAKLTRARAVAQAGGAPQAAIDAASALWPVTVGGSFAAVVEAFRAYGERCAKVAEEGPPDGYDSPAIAAAIRALK
jgi:hypothetical protein